jgi:hypothetical protein
VASQFSIKSSTQAREVAATASTPFTLSIRPARRAQAQARLPASAFRKVPPACRQHRLLTTCHCYKTEGVVPYNMCVLKGFPTALSSTTSFPFGIWFANDHTLYVADEGDGYEGGLDLYTHAASQTTAGLQKWIFDSTAGAWKLAYVLQNNLGLGVSYTVSNYPTGLNLATCIVAKGAPNPNNCPTSKTLSVANSAPDGLPWAPATDGLRNITGILNGDGTATIFAITSTVS